MVMVMVMMMTSLRLIVLHTGALPRQVGSSSACGVIDFTLHTAGSRDRNAQQRHHLHCLHRRSHQRSGERCRERCPMRFFCEFHNSSSPPESVSCCAANTKPKTLDPRLKTVLEPSTLHTRP
eukprot:3444771-Rhodomonas_salina.1